MTTELPTLAELDRFPGLDACHARVRVLSSSGTSCVWRRRVKADRVVH
jgi:hypothetical protein